MSNIKNYDAVVYPIFKEELTKEMGNFKAKVEEVFYTTTIEDDNIKFNIYTGLGSLEEFEEDTLRRAIGKAAKEAKRLGSSKVAISFKGINSIGIDKEIGAMMQGALLALYKYDKFKTSENNDKDIEFCLLNTKDDDIETVAISMEENTSLVDSVILARDLTNEPANYLYPKSLANRVEEIFKDSDVKVKIYSDKECKEMKMDAFLSVAKGSKNKPKLIVMRYMGDSSSDEIVGLIGKGVTYDSGGYSIKPTDSMVTMNGDMGGAATVIATMKAISENKIKKNVVAVVAACENLISGESYKPGDIINSMAGKTIEVLNTDAEGRLTLIDAVTYAIRKEKVTRVIDVATLTGAAIVALGEDATLVLSNDDQYYNELIESSKGTGEKFWRMPMFKEYERKLKGEYADLKNTGGRDAGSIVAGMFIREFVENKPWIHLDIAGTAYTKNPTKSYIAKGATGETVRTLYNLLKK